MAPRNNESDPVVGLWGRPTTTWDWCETNYEVRLQDSCDSCKVIFFWQLTICRINISFYLLIIWEVNPRTPALFRIQQND